MAMKHFVEQECGGANPLMNLAGHFTQDKARKEDNVRGEQWGTEHQAFHEIPADELVKEYIRGPNYNTAPQTFRMDALLNEMQRMEQSHHMIPSHPETKAEAWASEYLESNPTRADSARWVDEYTNQYLPQEDGKHSVIEGERHEKWAHEYLDNALHATRLERDSTGMLEKTAKEILQHVDDDEILNTEFMKTVKSLSEGGSLVDTEVPADAAEWIKEYEKEISGLSADAEAQKLIDEYSLTESETDYWQKMQREWDEMARDDIDSEHPWLKQYTDELKKEYTFEEDNPFKDYPNAFEEGVIKLKEGDLISAILLFEEAVRADPSHAEAWQYLGTSQAENEQESHAISALNRCCELQPDNLTARMALAASYTNESLQLQACDSLKKWLHHHPRYKIFVPDEAASRTTKVSTLMTKEEFDEVHDRFIDAAQLSADGSIDADVQVGLGVLFNLNGEYDKAVDCFNTGLQARPDDSYMWNKLGATLANSGRSEEAVEAYRHALHLNPAYNRARYNLGISCLNLGAHVEAVEHFLTALNMQRKGESPSGAATTMSDSIWSTLRMTISLLGRTDLHPVIQNRDLERLNQEFKMN